MHMRDNTWAEERGMICESERQIERARDKLLASVHDFYHMQAGKLLNDLAAAKQKSTIYG